MVRSGLCSNHIHYVSDLDHRERIIIHIISFTRGTEVIMTSGGDLLCLVAVANAAAAAASRLAARFPSTSFVFLSR